MRSDRRVRNYSIHFSLKREHICKGRKNRRPKAAKEGVVEAKTILKDFDFTLLLPGSKEIETKASY